MNNGRDNIFFYGNSNPELAKTVASGLDFTVGESDVKRFSDGETAVRLYTHIRDADVYLFQSTSKPANDHLMELLVLADATKRSSSNSIISFT